MALDLNSIGDSIKNTFKNLTSTHTHTWVHKDQVFGRIAPKKYTLKNRDICSDKECGKTRLVDMEDSV